MPSEYVTKQSHTDSLPVVKLIDECKWDRVDWTKLKVVIPANVNETACNNEKISRYHFLKTITILLAYWWHISHCRHTVQVVWSKLLDWQRPKL